uniref:Uncharacterized protein n=1 Tax=Arundo donax TaxID=35708 RepID=A0A0A9DMC2_ARUDO
MSSACSSPLMASFRNTRIDTLPSAGATDATVATGPCVKRVVETRDCGTCGVDLQASCQEDCALTHMETPAPTATTPSPEPVHPTAATAKVSVMDHLRSQPNEAGAEEGAGWKTETELAAAAASSPPPRPHQATVETGARRSMTWRKNGESSSALA